jgi:hypothetical protein
MAQRGVIPACPESFFQFKKMSRQKKINLIQLSNPTFRDLHEKITEKIPDKPE